MNSIKKIARNIGISGISQIFASILTFILLIFAARYLGEAQFGIYSFALAFTSLFIIFTDFGISQLIIREVARNKDKTNEYITNAQLIKIIFSFFTFGVIALVINLMRYPQDVINVVYIFAIYIILTSFAQAFMSIFQAYERIEYIAITVLVEKIIILSIGLLVLNIGYGLLGISYVYLLASITSIIICLIITFKKFEPRLRIKITIWKKLTKLSLPFGLNTLFGMLFFNIDAVLLSILISSVAVGIYSAAYNPLLALSMIISGMFVTAIYPVMSRFFLSSKNSLNTITTLSSKYLMIIGLPIAVGCLLLADRIIIILYGGQFSSSIIVFQILALFIPIRLISSVTGTLLTSINKQTLRTFSVFLSAILNIILNLLLIPYFSYVGASIATVLSEIFLYFAFIYFINKHFTKLKLYKNYTKPLISSIIMGMLIFYFKEVNLFLLTIFAILVYISMLFLLKTFTEEDKLILKKIMQ